jgi:hypothetical protein
MARAEILLSKPPARRRRNRRQGTNVVGASKGQDDVDLLHADLGFALGQDRTHNRRGGHSGRWSS